MINIIWEDTKKISLVIKINISRQKEIKTMLCSCEECKDPDNYFKSLRKLGAKLEEDEQLNNKLDFLNALGNKERLIIINILKDKDRCVCELEAILNKSQPSISHHLRILEKVGLIRGWKKGKFTYYGLEKEKLKMYLAIINEEFNFYSDT